MRDPTQRYLTIFGIFRIGPETCVPCLINLVLRTGMSWEQVNQHHGLQCFHESRNSFLGERDPGGVNCITDLVDRQDPEVVTVGDVGKAGRDKQVIVVDRLDQPVEVALIIAFATFILVSVLRFLNGGFDHAIHAAQDVVQLVRAVGRQFILD